MERSFVCSTTGLGVVCDDGHHYDRIGTIPTSSPMFWVYVFICFLLVLLSAIFSGLVIGILSLDALSLRILADAGETERDRWAARKILPFVNRHHYVMVTLIASTAACNEALPIVMGYIFSELVTIILSITLITLFGELFPQAIGARYGLVIGAYAAPLVIFMMIIWFPIAFPFSLLLDWILGKNHALTRFDCRTKFKALIKLHGPRERKSAKLVSAQAHQKRLLENNTKSDPGHVLISMLTRPSRLFLGSEKPTRLSTTLSKGEVRIIRGALGLKEKLVYQSMIPVQQVFMLGMDDVIDEAMREKLVQKKYTRIAVYQGSRSNITKVLRVHSLITLDRSRGHKPPKIKDIHRLLLDPVYVPATMVQYDLLKMFQMGFCHLAVVMDEAANTPPGQPGRLQEAIGIITMEDILEEILQTEIYDEMDYRRRARPLGTLDDTSSIHSSAAFNSRA